MSEYVSKEELKKFFESIEITVAGRTRAEAISEVLQAIYNGVMELPTTDAEKVIRCKDCDLGVFETYGEYGHYCCHDQYIETGEEFCAWAEPKVKE